jgi:chloride channel 7
MWQIFGSIFGVAAGFVVGKEGPMVHTGACVASLLGQGGSRKYRLTWKWLRYFKNDRDRRDLITCGAAAGVAAAFRAPVGGVLFALEEAASWSLFFSLFGVMLATARFSQGAVLDITKLLDYLKQVFLVEEHIQI